MSAIGGVSGAVPQAMVSSASAQKAPVAAARMMARDSDGDFDGTAPGQVDPADAGKGLNVDKMA